MKQITRQPGAYFFIVGAQRSGTSYLYQMLAEHPEIEMAGPMRPEPKIFLIEAVYQKGLDYYTSHFFGRKAGAWLRGEKSTSYLESETAAARIAQTFPEAKIVVLLRDPIERAISNYWFSVNNGLESKSMAEAFFHEEERRHNYDANNISVSPYAYLRRGRYTDYLTIYERLFPQASIKILLYEQLVGSLETIRDLYTFLGASPNFIPSTLDKIINATDKLETELSSDLEHYLIEYFAETNAQLNKHFRLDLARWRSWNRHREMNNVRISNSIQS